MTIIFSAEALDHYLMNVTLGWFDDEDLPPDDLQAYAPFVKEMQYHAINHHDLEDLQYALQYAILTPDFNYQRFNGGRYPYTDQQIRDIMVFAYHSLWHDDVLPQQPPDVALVDIPLMEWWNSKADHNQTDA